jgi:hypothetical protein
MTKDEFMIALNRAASHARESARIVSEIRDRLESIEQFQPATKPKWRPGPGHRSKAILVSLSDSHRIDGISRDDWERVFLCVRRCGFDHNNVAYVGPDQIRDFVDCAEIALSETNDDGDKQLLSKTIAILREHGKGGVEWRNGV